MIILIEEDIKPFQSETHTNTCSGYSEQYNVTRILYTCVYLSRWWKNRRAYLLMGSLYSSMTVFERGLQGV